MGILEKLFRRASIIPRVPPQDRASSIDPQACERIIREYGAVLEKTASLTFGAPESLLPYAKAEIQIALKQALLLTEDPGLKEQLKVGYLELARFIPDPEAQVAAAGNAAMLSGDPDHSNWKHIEAMLAISKRILGDQQRLLAEVQSL